MGKTLDDRCGEGLKCTFFPSAEVSPRLSKSCIFRQGDHRCPAGPYKEKLPTLYGWLSDTRSCGSCNARASGGTYKCNYELSIGEDDPSATCSNNKPVTADEMCVKPRDPNKPALGGYFPHTIFAKWDETATFDGECVTPDWGPRGEAKLEIPVTVCCQDLKLPAAR